jgi:hypothetical protein
MNEFSTPCPEARDPKATPDEYRITLAHPLELEDAPDFVSWPPRVDLDSMIALCEAELKRRAAAGIPAPRSTPVSEEFVL